MHFTPVDITPGNTPGRQTLTLTDPNPEPLVIQGATTSAPFSVDDSQCKGRTLASGAACALAISFSPSTLGPQSAPLTITQIGVPDSTIPLTGTGELILAVSFRVHGDPAGTGVPPVSVGDAAGTFSCSSDQKSPCDVHITSTAAADLTLVPTSSHSMPTAGEPTLSLYFDEWEGACTGYSTCTVTLTVDAAVTAYYVLM
jgi:hypothetical protein